MKRVVIESPFAASSTHTVDDHLRYLRACMADCIKHDEAPYASHGLYTQPGVLDDNKPMERELGIVAGFAWRDVSDLTVVYTDLGITKGMQYGIDDANRKGRPVEHRVLGAPWSELAYPVAHMPAGEVVGIRTPDGVDRCIKCQWPLAASIAEGCVPGNCSHRGAR